jgi:hypothetical protein
LHEIPVERTTDKTAKIHFVSFWQCSIREICGKNRILSALPRPRAKGGEGAGRGGNIGHSDFW